MGTWLASLVSSVFHRSGFHAIWKSPDDELIDITPKKKQVDQIIFLTDNTRPYEGRQVNNVRVNTTNNNLVDDYFELWDAKFRLLNKDVRASKNYEIIYEKAIGKLKTGIKQISEELEKSNFNLSSPLELIDKGVVFPSDLANCWLNGDYEERQMVQNILFPERIIYDKENDTYRTSSVNKVVELIAELSASYHPKKRETNQASC